MSRQSWVISGHQVTLGHRLCYGQYKVKSIQGLEQVSRANSAQLKKGWVKLFHFRVRQVNIGHLGSIQVIPVNNAGWRMSVQRQSNTLNWHWTGIHWPRLFIGLSGKIGQVGSTEVTSVQIGPKWVKLAQVGSCFVRTGMLEWWVT